MGLPVHMDPSFLSWTDHAPITFTILLPFPITSGNQVPLTILAHTLKKLTPALVSPLLSKSCHELHLHGPVSDLCAAYDNIWSTLIDKITTVKKIKKQEISNDWFSPTLHTQELRKTERKWKATPSPFLRNTVLHFNFPTNRKSLKQKIIFTPRKSLKQNITPHKSLRF